jgi:predicted lipid-binding transport protein (Tim44 family)
LAFKLWKSRSRSAAPVLTDSVGAPVSPIDGAWTHSSAPAMSSIRGDLFPGTADLAHGPEPSEAGLAAIVARDPGFHKDIFLEQVQSAFYVVEGAWTQRNPAASRQIMADGLWNQHRVQMQGYVDGHKRNVLEGLTVATLTIIAAHTDSSYDTICVRILAASSDYDVDDNTGKVTRGKKEMEQWSEDWTFQRSSAAQTPKGGGTLANHCPNCGAPLQLDLTGVCSYCKALVSDGTFDWVLARIAALPPDLARAP